MKRCVNFLPKEIEHYSIPYFPKKLVERFGSTIIISCKEGRLVSIIILGKPETDITLYYHKKTRLPGRNKEKNN